MPAGRGRTCEGCYWSGLFARRVEANKAGFSSPRIQDAYESFSQWFLVRSGPHRAALKINGHYSFFARLDEHWGDVPSYEELLRVFGALGLRRAENTMRWLAETKAVEVSIDARDDHTERLRISKMLSELPDFWSKQLLHGYHAELGRRLHGGGTDLRSIRLAIRAAVNFLKVSTLAPNERPEMKALEAFWRSSPGQVAAVTGFVGYLNKSYGTELQTRPDKRWLEKAKRDKTERELVALLKGDGHPESEAIWITKALAYFHNVRRLSRKALVYRPDSFKGMDGFGVEHEGKVLWVPAPTTYTKCPTPIPTSE